LEEGPEEQFIYVSSSSQDIYLQDFGTTATICLYFPKRGVVLVASVGDSTAMLMGGKEGARTLTTCDNVDYGDKSEKKRVLRDYAQKVTLEGGYLGPSAKASVYSYHRLAMTRALGHKFLVNYGVLPNPREVRSFEIGGAGWIVVASDGIWDVLEGDEVLTIIKSGKTTREGAELLVKSVIELERDNPDCDNTTVALVRIEQKQEEKKETKTTGEKINKV